MWYFTWVLGVGFAVLLAIMNAMWGENEAARAASRQAPDALEAPPALPTPDDHPT
jgi:cytochrome bd-I ubiquinol oxidase subunit X